MGAIVPSKGYYVTPGEGVKKIGILTDATADSGDTVDVSSDTATGGPTLSTIYGAVAFDMTTGDSVTATFSSTTVTIDAAGGTTNHQYYIEVQGVQ